MKRLFLFALLLMGLGCDTQNFSPYDSETVVVEGFLYAGVPVDSFYVSELIPLISDEDSTYEISDAELYLVWNDIEVLLTPMSGNNGYYEYTGSEISIEAGENYQMKLAYARKEITATTTVPTPPTGLTLSMDTIAIAEINDFEDMQDRNDTLLIEVQWDNSAGDFYYVTVQNIEANPSDINQMEFGGMGGRPNFRFTTEPTSLDVYNIRTMELSQYGTHRVVLYHVNQEYADLFESYDQDSRTLTEPLTNINNGVGIFTSFSSDTTYFEVIHP